MKILVTLIFAVSTSLYAEEIEFFSSPKPLTPIGFKGKVSIGPCNDGARLPEDSKAKSFQKIVQFYSCDPEHQKSNLLTTNSCMTASACKLNTLATKESIQAVDDVLSEYLAKEQIKLELSNHADRMEKFEILRAYSQQVSERPFGKECSVRFDPSMPKAGTCNLALMDEAFKEHQNDCSVLDRACFSTDEENTLSFPSFAKKTKNPKASLMIDFFAYRINEKVKEKIKSRDEFAEKLGDYVTSDEFKKAKPDEKAELFISFVDKNSKIADPLLSFDLNNGKSAKERLANSKELVSLFEKTKISKNSFLKDYKKYSDDRANEIFSKKGNSCKDVGSIRNFCADMTKIAKGGKVSKSDNNAKLKYLNLKKIKIDEIKDPTILDRIKSRTENRVTDQNIEIIINAKKCEAFGMSGLDPETTPGEDSKSPSDSIRHLVSTRAIENIFITDHSEYIAPINKDSPFAPSFSSTWSSNDLVDDTTSAKSAVSSSKNSISTTPSTIVDDHGPVSMAPTNYVSPSNISGNFENSPYSQGSFSPLIPNSTVDEATQGIEGIRSGTSAGSQFAGGKAESDMEGLKAKLAAAEAKVEQMKVEAKKVEDDKIEAERIRKEEELVKDLKDQIAALKEKKSETPKTFSAVKKAAREVRPPDEDDEEAEVVESTTPRRIEYVEPPREVVEYRELPSSRNAPSENSRSGSNAAAGEGLVLSSSRGSEREYVSQSGAVLTSIDGLSAEEFNKLAQNNIVNLKLKSFFITENGVVKEVFPEVDEKGELVYEKDGTLKLTKLLKGKATDAKYAVKNAGKTSGRAPASIASNADLSKSEEIAAAQEAAKIRLRELNKLIEKSKVK